MKQIKRILAMAGVILLALLYLSTLIFALLGKEFLNWLMAAAAATIIVPVLIWAYGFIYRLLKGDATDSSSFKKT